MTRRIKIIIFFILLGALIGAFILLKKEKPSLADQWDKADFAMAETYEVSQENEQFSVANTSARLYFTVPRDWFIDKSLASGLRLYSPDAQRRQNSVLMGKGCEIGIETRFLELNIEQVREKMKQSNWKKHSAGIAALNINGREGLKMVLEEKESFNMYQEEIYIPANGKTYVFRLNAAESDKDACSQKFSDILQTISIK